MDRYDPNEWTDEFVKSNLSFCLTFLGEINRDIVSFLKQGNCKTAIAGIDRMLNGAIVIQNSKCLNMKPILATYSFNQGLLIACALDDAPENKRRETALASFLDARDFSTAGMYDVAAAAIEQLKSGCSFDEIKNNFCPQFPSELIVLMSDTDIQIEKMKSSASASGRPSSASSGGCYVATCIYGSYDCPQVWTLRRYRDFVLANSWFGRLFIHAYYAVSPALVKFFGKTEWFRKMCKAPLDRLVFSLNAKGFDSTFYKDSE